MKGGWVRYADDVGGEQVWHYVLDELGEGVRSACDPTVMPVRVIKEFGRTRPTNVWHICPKCFAVWRSMENV